MLAKSHLFMPWATLSIGRTHPAGTRKSNTPSVSYHSCPTSWRTLGRVSGAHVTAMAFPLMPFGMRFPGRQSSHTTLEMRGGDISGETSSSPPLIQRGWDPSSSMMLVFAWDFIARKVLGVSSTLNAGQISQSQTHWMQVNWGEAWQFWEERFSHGKTIEIRKQRPASCWMQTTWLCSTGERTNMYEPDTHNEKYWDHKEFSQ